MLVRKRSLKELEKRGEGIILRDPSKTKSVTRGNHMFEYSDLTVSEEVISEKECLERFNFIPSSMTEDNQRLADLLTEKPMVWGNTEMPSSAFENTKKGE